jgi:hypothetical protein
MGIHVKTGSGAPSGRGDPGAHYVDIDTGVHYLFGTNAWKEVGAGGGGLADPMVVNAGDLDFAPWDLDLNQSFVLLENMPGSGTALINCNPIPAKTARVRLMTLMRYTVRLQNMPPSSEMRVIQRGNVTFTAGTGFADFEPPVNSVLSINILYLPFTSRGHMLLVEADSVAGSAITSAS